MKNETIEFKETETTLVVLPEEVKELALRVPESKQKEVQTLLSQIFAGTDDWERQVDAIEVKGINDIMSMQLAGVARKNAKNTRLAAEKLIDAKREEVQSRIQDDKVEDALWLKSKQIAQIKFKAIEEKAEWKEKFKERFEAEQKELTTQLRIEKVSKFTNDINRIALENMSDQIFDIFLSGIEKAFNDKLEAERKQEEERLAVIETERIRQENIRLENERLKKEIEVKEKALQAERENAAKVLAEQKAKDAAKIEKEILYQKQIVKEAEIERKKQDQILADQKAKAEKERAELLAKNQANIERAEKERKEKEALLADIEAKKQADLKVKQAEQKAKLQADKKAQLAPDKTKLLNFGQLLNDVPRPEIKSIEAAQVMSTINGYLAKLDKFIVDESGKL